MTDVKMTDEQFEKLLKTVKESQAAPAPSPGLGALATQGLGAPSEEAYPLKAFDRHAARQVLGIGAVSDGVDEMSLEGGVWALLAAGSPRLALARAIGVGFAPYFVNVRATFPTTDTTDVPQVGSDVKIVQDTLIDCLVVSIRNQSNTANLSIFQPQSDFFFKQQSGFEALLDVQGAPRYPVASKFTPLETLGDTFVGDSKWPRQWILTYQQQLFMSFHATVTLPFAPIEVVCSFRAYTAIGEAWAGMTNKEALDMLASECGIVVSSAYRSMILNRKTTG